MIKRSIKHLTIFIEEFLCLDTVLRNTTNTFARWRQRLVINMYVSFFWAQAGQVIVIQSDTIFPLQFCVVPSCACAPSTQTVVESRPIGIETVNLAFAFDKVKIFPKKGA